MRDTKIEINIADDEFHEKVFAEVLYEDKLLVVLSQEDESGELLLEFPGSDHLIYKSWLHEKFRWGFLAMRSAWRNRSSA